MIIIYNYKKEDLIFEEINDKVRCTFWENYYFEIRKQEIEKIGDFRIRDNSIFINAGEQRINRRMSMIILNGFEKLNNKITGRHTIFIDRNTRIPLLGSTSFGIVDRNTSLIEIKPMTGCNLECIFCSVDEGKSGKWTTDFLVDYRYIIEEYNRIVDLKGCDVEAHIGTQGEPFLYPKLTKLIRGLKHNKLTKTISIDTNGCFLTKTKIDKLAGAGLTRINLSLNAIDKMIAGRLSGASYNINYVLKMAKYAVKKLDLLLAPVWVPGINDDEIPKLIGLSQDLKAKIGIQNMLNYKYGRNPMKAMPWAVFTQKMAKLEKKYGVKLLLDEKDFGIVKTKNLSKPFRKGDIIKAEIVCDGRLKNEKIAVAQGRNISVKNCTKKRIVKVKITRDKHNIFFGRCL